jgi:tRNA pseudouridine55 synthase
MTTDGVLVIDKPAGMTSHDVVDVIRKRFKTKKVGHAGTLDPDATGLLLVGVGKATRFLAYAQNAPKRYVATARFGTTTSTQDASGEVLATTACTFSKDELLRSLEKFTGDIEQIPPMVSAVKIDGERLHAKARRGETVERAARPVTIYQIELIAFIEGDPTEAQLDVRCSSGTYVRTLINDVGDALGCGAHMTTLRRTETGGFSLDEATALDDIAAEHLLDLRETVRVLPSVDLSDEHAKDVSFGRKLPAALADDVSDDAFVALRANEKLVAVYKKTGDELAADRVVPV